MSRRVKTSPPIPIVGNSLRTQLIAIKGARYSPKGELIYDPASVRAAQKAMLKARTVKVKTP